ncbi:putative uncharacterized transposon-derived protein F54H12.3 [Trichonephila clavipes]|nr:putative uncharacterized transposon-derived protein F54H12.3 [Trichonephila clavipes]
MHQDLAAFYENPEVPNSFGGVEALHRSVKGKYSKKDVKHWLSQKDAYTLHKPVRHKFQRNRVFVSDIDRQFQADLVDMQSLAEFNKGYKYLLTCIDLFSKFAWAVPLKDKFGKSVKSGLEIIFKERKPKVLQTDAGKEFLNKNSSKLFKKSECNFFFFTNNETKASIVERFNRTLKTKMWKYFTEFNTKNYIDVIDKLIHSYNHSYHRSIKMEPVSVSRHNRKQVLKNLYGGLRNEKPKAPRFKIGDVVRINKQKLHFEKGYEQNWRRELFIVFEIVQRIPIVYRLKDLQGEEIKGTYYEAELQKVVDSGFYPVENVIKQRKRGGITEYFVKFLGYPEKFNEWNRRDQSQITHLGRQLYPRKVKFFQECYADATSKPYGYLLIDLKPETDESLRVRTGFNGRRKNNSLFTSFTKYTHFSNENRRESEPVPNAASLSENQETESLKENLKESVVKTEKEVFEDEIFIIVPARYKEKAKNIFQFLKLQESFSWNSDGEIIYKNTVIPGSNIAFLVNDFLRNRKSAPEGRYVFLRALNDVNLPKNLDVNKKLYQNNKIIKKPIMYARRNAWLKL